MRMAACALTLLATIGLAVPTGAQQVDITAPGPQRSREPVVIPPGDHYSATRPSDGNFYPRGPRVRHDPAYIGPLSSKTADGTGRVGVAGWTAPNTPANGSEASGFREVTGWFAVGFAVEWGGPPSGRPPVRTPSR